MNIKLYSPQKYYISEQAFRFCIFLLDSCYSGISRLIALRPSTNLGPLSISIFLVLFCACFSTSSMAEDTSVNRLLASQCAQCHGPDGKAVGDMEKLTDESAKDLFEDLRDMRNEDEPENIMDHQALGYSQAQIRRISRYFGSLKNKKEDEEEDKEKEDEDEDEDEDSEDEDSEDEDSEDEDDEDKK